MLDRVFAVLLPIVLAAGVALIAAPGSAQLTPTAPADPALRADPNAMGPGLQGSTAPPPAPAVPSGAQVRETPGAFVVSNVGVDVTASSTAGAQEQAFAEGRRLAFAALMAQLGVRSDQIDPSSMSDAALSRLTRGFSVEEESSSPGRYRARLSYIFNPEAVRELLSERAVTTLAEESLPFGTDRADSAAAASGAPVLVLPVLREGAAARLWDSPNPWLDAWQNVDGGDRLVVPYGELQDVADVSVESALRGDGAAFRGIASRYGAGDTVVAVAQETGGGLAVSLTRYSGAGPGATQIVSVPGTDFATAVREALSALDRPPPGQPRVSGDTLGATPAMAGPAVGGLPPGDRLGGGMAVLVPFSRPGEWFQIRQRLAAVGNVVGVQVVSLSVDEAVLRLQFAGGEDALRGGMAARGLDLTRGPDGPVLRLSGPAF